MIGRVFTKNWWTGVVAKISWLWNVNDPNCENKVHRQNDGQVIVRSRDPRFLSNRRHSRSATRE